MAEGEPEGGSEVVYVRCVAELGGKKVLRCGRSEGEGSDRWWGGEKRWLVDPEVSEEEGLLNPR